MTEAEDLTETERKLTDLSAAIQKSLLDTSEEGLEQVLRLSAEFRKVSDEFIRSHPITPELQPRVRNCFFLIREQVRIVLDACTNARDKTGQELAKLRSGGKAKALRQRRAFQIGSTFLITVSRTDLFLVRAAFLLPQITEQLACRRTCSSIYKTGEQE